MVENSKIACEWQFVNRCNPAQRKDEDLQRVIRANAMRHYRRSQKQRSTARYKSNFVEQSGIANRSIAPNILVEDSLPTHSAQDVPFHADPRWLLRYRRHQVE